jgi:Dolichyl-phosphate-mannose-protein mannosyltransferase
MPALIVIAVTGLGAVLRIAVAGQSVFGDELSTYWIVSTNGLGGVVSTVHSNAEITPPFYFITAWLTTRVDLSPELLRAPSLLAGIICIPLTYLLGRRTVGSGAALVAATLTALAPFMIFYSAEARAYGLAIVLVLLSTLALLVAVDHARSAVWWIAYAACSCAAVYTHYTAVFALAGQLLWLLWAHPEARRPALVANVAAAVAFLPWLSGLAGDLESPTTDILSALQPFSPGFVRTSLAHWAVGYPYAITGTGVRDLPGTPALVMLALAVAVALAGYLRGARIALDRGAVLVIVLAASVPVGEALASAIGSNLFGTRNLAASWPGFALCLAALLAGAGPRLGLAAPALAIGAFAIGAVKMLDTDFQRPDYEAVAAFIDDHAGPGDVVVDGAIVSPAGAPTGLDLTLRGRHTVFRLGQSEVQYDPFRILALPPPTADVIRRAAAARPRRLLLVLAPQSQTAREAIAALPPGYRRAASGTFAGYDRIAVVVFEDQTAIGA